MAFDAFMIINVTESDTLPGESSDEKYGKLGACEILEFSFTSSDDAAGRIKTNLEKIAKFNEENILGFSFFDDDPSSFFRDNQDTKAKKLSITLSKYLDRASPGLLKAYCNVSDPKKDKLHKPFELVTILLRKAGGPKQLVYLKIALSKVDVTAYSLDVSSGKEPPKENLTLSFETFQVEYKSQSMTGETSAKSNTSILGWDFENNRPK
jgi:type VI protein secretion system component Hcp